MASEKRPLPIPSRPRRVAAAARASLSFLLLLALFVGLAAPQALVAFAHAVVPGSAGGSLLDRSNGTPYGSSDLGENVTNPALFWLRPSMIDYQAFVGNGTGAGNEVPPGPTDPALLNETAYYVRAYCNETRANLTVHCLENASVPIDLVTPSASGLDPDTSPAAALVQIPRVAFYSGLSQEFLRVLVNEHTTLPYAGLFGPAYVNVLALDAALLPALPPGTGY